MEVPEYRRMFDHEDHYWWYVSRRALVVDLVRSLRPRPGSLLVDVGCGTGATAQALEEFGRVVGLDASPEALAFSASRGIAGLLRGRAEAIPLGDRTADLIVATDILEHLGDDVGALAEFRRVLAPGGHAVVTVPAYRFLWSEHDHALMHRRRYVAGELTRKAREAGLEVVRSTYALGFLLPLAFGRLLRPATPPDGRTPEAQLKPVSPRLNAALIRFQGWETALLRHVDLPCGLSVAAVLHRPA